ncbi:MAG: endonuclease/exonuclease/phosphatase [Cytophagales bacterium]|nr:endonuclease/exonuclease/phosphatase [Cytophagales bacterium]
MKKFLKTIVLAIGLMLVFVIAFYFWASSGWLDSEDYNQVITFSEKSQPKDTLTVITYNLGYLSGMTNNLPIKRSDSLFELNLERAKNLLFVEDSDIICFQEIDFDSDRSKNYNQLDSLGIYHNYHQRYASVNWDKRYVPFPYWPPNLHFRRMNSGQAILSKFPIENIESVILEKPKEAPFYYSAFYLDRLVQIAEIRIGATAVKVMNVHLEAFYPKTRAQQAHVVKGLFEAYANEMPVILIGDFNSQAPWVDESDKVMETILSADHISSAVDQEQYESDSKNSYTFNSMDPRKMIDFILFNDNFIEKIDARVVQEAGQISDHLPVVMRFTFKSQNQPEVTE